MLLQRRSKKISSWPGYWDISAAGHIDAGETPVVAAVREAEEEIGLEVDGDRLVYVFSSRIPTKPNEIDHVFLYEVDNSFEPTCPDGEVEETKWIPLESVRAMFRDSDGAMLVNQGEGYFTLLTGGFERFFKSM